jgi:hypothetical protein
MVDVKAADQPGIYMYMHVMYYITPPVPPPSI